jgi:hypothetical protein
MLFKRLSESELKELEKEFIDFLVLNGIVADDWVALKDAKPQNASKMIDSFSDVVYASMMRNVKYLEHINPKEIMCFYCQPEQIVLVGIETTNAELDFTTMKDFSNISKISQDIQVFTTTKKYKKSREEEVFSLIENGAQISENELFNAICSVL